MASEVHGARRLKDSLSHVVCFLGLLNQLLLFPMHEESLGTLALTPVHLKCSCLVLCLLGRALPLI